MRAPRFLVLLSLVTCALGAASCGSDDSSPASPSGDGGVTTSDSGKPVLGVACDAGDAASLPASRSGSPSCSMTRGAGIAPDGGAGDGGASDGGASSGGGGSCASDADCTAGSDGRCADADARARFLSCSYDQCFADSDCSSGSVCICGSRDGTVTGANSCVPSTCASDADCGAGFTCAASGNATCANYDDLEGYYCHSTKDDCLNDCDCADVDGGGDGDAKACRYEQAAAKWSCIVGTCEG